MALFRRKMVDALGTDSKMQGCVGCQQLTQKAAAAAAKLDDDGWASVAAGMTPSLTSHVN
jgi:hypothetical protein